MEAKVAVSPENSRCSSCSREYGVWSGITCTTRNIVWRVRRWKRNWPQNQKRPRGGASHRGNVVE